MASEPPASTRVRAFWKHRGLDLDGDQAREAASLLAEYFLVLDALDLPVGAPAPKEPRAGRARPRRGRS